MGPERDLTAPPTALDRTRIFFPRSKIAEINRLFATRRINFRNDENLGNQLRHINSERVFFWEIRLTTKTKNIKKKHEFVDKPLFWRLGHPSHQAHPAHQCRLQILPPKGVHELHHGPASKQPWGLAHPIHEVILWPCHGSNDVWNPITCFDPHKFVRTAAQAWVLRQLPAAAAAAAAAAAGGSCCWGRRSIDLGLLGLNLYSNYSTTIKTP